MKTKMFEILPKFLRLGRTDRKRMHVKSGTLYKLFFRGLSGCDVIWEKKKHVNNNNDGMRPDLNCRLCGRKQFLGRCCLCLWFKGTESLSIAENRIIFCKWKNTGCQKRNTGNFIPWRSSRIFLYSWRQLAEKGGEFYGIWRNGKFWKSLQCPSGSKKREKRPERGDRIWIGFSLEFAEVKRGVNEWQVSSQTI